MPLAWRVKPMDGQSEPCHQASGMGLTETALIAAPGAADAAALPVGDDAAGATLALFLLVVIGAAWLALRTFVRSLRARKTERAVGANFAEYALEALVNAAKIDGRVNDDERRAVARAVAEMAGPTYNAQIVEAAFGKARLSKDELVAYLAARSKVFSRDQKVALLNALLAVFVSDGKFDEREHAALVDYTAAIGFDRQGAPDMLRNLTRNFTRGNIT
jgi:tellurite resistance protein